MEAAKGFVVIGEQYDANEIQIQIQADANRGKKRVSLPVAILGNCQRQTNLSQVIVLASIGMRG